MPIMNSDEILTKIICVVVTNYYISRILLHSEVGHRTSDPGFKGGNGVYHGCIFSRFSSESLLSMMNLAPKPTSGNDLITALQIP